MNSTINVRWSGPHKPNWGDELNKTLVKLISGKDPVYVDDYHKHHYLCVGSILRWGHRNTTIWGSGFISETDKILEQPVVTAVRGPLSRDKMINMGLDCPKIYGDPALLYPRLYKPISDKKYKWGIIPHYIDADNSWVANLKDNPNVNIINVLDSNINNFVEEVNKCEVILSSSLHGIICGDSYGIPSYWIKLSDNVIGNGFKFVDYFKSVNRKQLVPIKINHNTKLTNIKVKKYKINIDLDALYEACPFR